jgi:hypothetical protein
VAIDPAPFRGVLPLLPISSLHAAGSNARASDSRRSLCFRAGSGRWSAARSHHLMRASELRETRDSARDPDLTRPLISMRGAAVPGSERKVRRRRATIAFAFSALGISRLPWRHRDRPMGRRARRDARLLSPGAITRLACSARSLATASAHATRRAGVIAMPRKGASAPTDADDRFDDSPTSAGRSPPMASRRPPSGPGYPAAAGRRARVLSANALVSRSVPVGPWRLSPSPKSSHASRAIDVVAIGAKQPPHRP